MVDIRVGVVLVWLQPWIIPVVAAQSLDIEAPPILYSETADDNPVSRLIARIESGETVLRYERDHGYLKSLLSELDVPVESQVLVFSKTSLQVQHISRRNPRAIYFNDDIYIGWVRGSSLMEVSTSDPRLGAVFYTIETSPRNVDIDRATYDCLACHLSTLTQGIPGHTVRSVFPKYDGSINVQTESFVTDHTTPLGHRFGGWYVTGDHGGIKHMGNAVLRGDALDSTHSFNLANLRDEFDAQDWLTPHSDIVALMVLEHQTQMHNTFTRASFAVRRWLYDMSNVTQTEGSQREFDVVVAQQAKSVVDAMLFCGEAVLDNEIIGHSGFTTMFSNRGPADGTGRSLRQFDLQSRLMKYPCSFLVYSSSFDNMPESLRVEVITQLQRVLDGSNRSPDYNHLDAEIRTAILEILSETKPGFVKS